MSHTHLIMQWIAWIITIVFADFWLVAKVTANTFWKFVFKFGAILVIVYIILEILKVQY